MEDDLNIGLTDRLASLASQINTADPVKYQVAIDSLSQTIGTLPWIFTADEALTLQALALSIVELIRVRGADDEIIQGLASHLERVLKGAGNYLELQAGANLADRAFFEPGRMKPIH